MFDEANIKWVMTTQACWTYIEAEYRRADGFHAVDLCRVRHSPFADVDPVDAAKPLIVERLRGRYDEHYGISRPPNIPSSYEELDQSDDLHDDPKDARREALPSKAYCGYDAPSYKIL